MDLYKKKYLKYKSKYLSSKEIFEQVGGAFTFEAQTDIYPIAEPEEEGLKKNASDQGKQLLENWLAGRAANGINTVLSKFNENGTKIEDLSATTFSDYYKWTMMPVIWHLHKLITEKTSKKTFNVTFGIDIRDNTMRDAINKDPALRTYIKTALENFAKRKFKKGIFTEMNEGKYLLNNTIPTECIDYICGKDTVRSLASSVSTSEKGRPVVVDDEEVHISFFKVDTAKYSPKDEQPGLWFIEARGPWPRVTWLETSLMQAVYEAYLRYNLKKIADESGKEGSEKINENQAYQRWLYGALLRCAKSVAYTRLVQQDKNMTPALFTGRRTGGYLFLLLQNLFFAHHFNQFRPPPGDEKEKENWKKEMFTDDGKTPSLGTSSVDCYYELKALGLNCLNPVGTHAHELSMVISVLFPYFDKNKFFLPLTQIIGHYLYRKLSAEPRPTPSGLVMFPMLPDTLGTAAFMKAANWVKMSDGKSFITLINSARQDSGKLENFKILMQNWGYQGGMMASEIDDAETLSLAAESGYTTCGAGGFYGDSVKVWNTDKKYHPPSMAVKVVKVEYCIHKGEEHLYRELYFPHINISYNNDDTFHVKGFPIKVGDPENMDNAALAEGKLSLDKTLPADLIEAIKCWVSYRRVLAFDNKDDDTIRKSSLNIETFMETRFQPITSNLGEIRD